MQIIKSILLLALFSLSLSATISSTRDTLFHRVMDEFLTQLPEMEKEVSKPEIYPTNEIQQIIGKGFNYYYEHASASYQYKIPEKNLIPFLKSVIKKNNFPSTAINGDPLEFLSLIKFAKFREIVSTDVGFSVDQTTNKCRYVQLMGMKNEDKTYDFLIGKIDVDFQLASDFYVYIEKKSSSWFGLKKTYKENVVEVKKTIDKDQLIKLFTYFEIVIFKRFANVLGLLKTKN